MILGSWQSIRQHFIIAVLPQEVYWNANNKRICLSDLFRYKIEIISHWARLARLQAYITGLAWFYLQVSEANEFRLHPSGILLMISFTNISLLPSLLWEITIPPPIYIR